MKPQKILITTGIYPPAIGGPAQYAKNLKESLEQKGYLVTVKMFNIEHSLPVGIRHLFFFFKILPTVFVSEGIITLDTFSVGLPTVLASKIFFKKCIIRTGGDFLWEQYVERTKKKVLLSDFYDTEKTFFSKKEKIIFDLTRWSLRNAKHIVFSTEWQRVIFIKAYGLRKENTSVVENYYGPKEEGNIPENKTFIASSRRIFLKNEETLYEVFRNIPEATLFSKQLPFSDFMQKLKHSYAVIAPSLSEISPNLILDAIRFNRPFICTKDVGIYDRIKDAGIFVDPRSLKEIELAIRELLSEEGYKKAKERVENFNFTHTWQEIAQEFISIFEKL